MGFLFSVFKGLLIIALVLALLTFAVPLFLLGAYLRFLLDCFLLGADVYVKAKEYVTTTKE